MSDQIPESEQRTGLENIRGVLGRINLESAQRAPVSTPEPRTPACSICQDLGFVRKDVPIHHPDFGRVDVCVCKKEDARQAELRKMYRLCGLDAFVDMTFDTFDVAGKGAGELVEAELQRALSTCLMYAENPLNHWLLLMGGYGCGKTHLAAAIAHLAVESNIRTLMMTVPDLLDLLREDYNERHNQRNSLDDVRDVDLLILDDLGTQNSTPWAIEKLFQIINYRYVKKLSTVFTTNLRMENIDGRIASRIRDVALVTIVDIKAPDYRQRPAEAAQGSLFQPSSALLPSALPYFANELFERFDPRTSMEKTEHQQLDLAYQGAWGFAQNPAGWLVLIGPSGTGKTYLAACVANERAKRGEEPLFMLVADLLDWLRSTYDQDSNVSFDEAYTVLKTTKLLVLDEFVISSQSPWAVEKLYQILYHRSIMRLPTVITTTTPLSEIEPRFRKFFLNKGSVKTYLLNITPFLGSLMMSEDNPPRGPRSQRPRLGRT